MAMVYQFVSPALESPEMSLDFEGAVVQLRFFDALGAPVAVSGLPRVYQRFGPAEFEVQLFGTNDWRFNGPCDQVRVDLASVTGFAAYRVLVWRTADPLPVMDPRLLTGTTNPRLRVDPAQTSFFEKREYRTFKEWATPTTELYVIKAVVPVNIILFELNASIEAGTIRIETVAGGTPGGTFGETLPAFAANTMTEAPPAVPAQVVLTAGGTHTGGTVLDVLRGKAADNSNFAASVGSSTGAERGVGPASFHFRITLAAATGVFKARWEERP